MLYTRLFLLLLLLLPLVAPARSRRLAGLWAGLAQHPRPDAGREQALWRLAWEKEVPPAQQDSLAQAATALARQLGDPAGLVLGQVQAARQALAAGHRDAARQLLSPALAQARRLRDPWVEMVALVTLGRIYWGSTRHSQALGCWQQAWAAAQRQPDVAWRARTALLQANYHSNYALGLDWYFRSLALAERADCQSCQTNALGGIAYNYSLLDELDLAERYARQALGQQQQMGDHEGERGTLIVLAGLLEQQGRYQAAEAIYQRVYQQVTQPADSLTVAAGLASIYEKQGRYAEARQQARVALALAYRLGDMGLVTLLEASLATVALRTGQLDSAVRYGQRAWQRRQPGGGRQTTADACHVLAQAYAGRGEYQLAYDFQTRYLAYKDTTTNDKIRDRAAQARYSYQLAKEQRRAAVLARDQTLASLRRQRWLAAGALLGLGLLAAGAALVRAARRRQRRRLAALREQIAADLHDEVGGLLTQLALEGAYLRDTQPTTPAQAQHLDRVADVSQQAARQLRDVVWSIDTRHNSVADLLDQLRDYQHELLGSADLEAGFAASPALAALTLPLPVRDALYFVFKEALHNVVKHAHARQVLVQLRLAGSQHLELTVDDDGRGLDPAVAATALTRGLRNMSRRAAAAAGEVAFEPSELGGLRVRLRLPLR